MNKTISDEAEMQSKMRPTRMEKMTTNEDERQSKLLVKQKILPTKDQGHTQMSTERKMPTKEDGSQRQLSIKKKPMKESTNETKGKIGGDSNHKLDNDEKEALIPTLSLDEFFEKLGILEDDDEEYEHDYDDHVPTDDGKEKKKRTRGPTQLKHIQNMEGRLEIEWNANNGKPIVMMTHSKRFLEKSNPVESSLLWSISHKNFFKKGERNQSTKATSQRRNCIIGNYLECQNG
ncbi:hypothetical protein PIB30_005879 [Stylosanthes scabra]|uniref:Uncharacterized protein n=1 Tax=Stylosanthes scabra TaxID=79078 RepID=A0ABU6Q4Z8_9FABA|nr:hypothetical protein [Stylosanthes scabra]